jgi:TrmH family RNA methyltransferase
MIASRYNPQFKELKSLLEARGAKKAGKILVSGRKIAPEMFARALTVIAEDGAWPDGLEQPNKVLWLDRGLFRDLDIFGTHFPIAVLPLPEIKKWDGEKPKGLELVLSLQDPSNLGAVLRSAHAFGVNKIILLKECAFPFHPKAVRASSGSCLRVPMEEGPALKEFSDQNAIALDMAGESLTQFSWPVDARLLIGEEGQGLPSQFTGKRVSIPMHAELDSLNAAIAASIALFSYRSQII